LRTVEKFNPLPYVTEVSLTGKYVGVAFSFESACTLFQVCSDLVGVVCVDIPRSGLVTNCRQAEEFFSKGEG
jgi:hypothetical protein